MRRPQSTRPALAALVATAVLSLIGGGFYMAGSDFAVTDVLDAVLFGGLMLGMSAIGILIAGREPGNPVGWLFSIAPLGVTVSVGTGTFAQWAGPDHHNLPGAALPAWLSVWAWPLGLLAFAMFLPLLFPDGRPPAGRWRLLVQFDLGVLALFALVLMTEPDDTNPIGIDGAARTPVVALAVVLIVAALVLGLASALARYRGTGPTERLQMRECLFAVGLTFAGFILISVLIPREALYTLDYALIPAAVGLAMLRYRLYDVDIVIRRTLVYAVLVAALAALYLAGIAVFGMTFRAATGLSSSFAVTLSTLAVAVAFQPLRRRIQAMVDRRFYRARYDAARTLEAFSARMRGEIDLETLTGDVVSVVRDALHPSHATVWLRPSEGER